MIRSVKRSAVVLLGAVALVGGLAGQVPAAAADEAPVVQTAGYETYDHRGYDDNCPDHHRREFRGGTTCDYNGHGRYGYGYCSYGDDGYYAYDDDDGHRRHYRHSRCGYYGDRYYYGDDGYYGGRYHYGDGDGDRGGDGDGDRGGDGDGGGDGGGNGGDD